MVDERGFGCALHGVQKRLHRARLEVSRVRERVSKGAHKGAERRELLRTGRLMHTIQSWHAEPCQVHMGLVWIKGLTLKAGPANVIGHVDRVLGMLEAGTLDPRPLVSSHMPLEQAEEAYALYDRREALKIVLTP